MVLFFYILPLQLVTLVFWPPELEFVIFVSKRKKKKKTVRLNQIKQYNKAVTDGEYTLEKTNIHTVQPASWMSKPQTGVWRKKPLDGIHIYNKLMIIRKNRNNPKHKNQEQPHDITNVMEESRSQRWVELKVLRAMSCICRPVEKVSATVKRALQ